MKLINVIKSFLYAFVLLIINMGCVNDDEYSTAPLMCKDLKANISIADLKSMYNGSTMEITNDLIVEGYVSSTDETGNIYKYLYIQDSPNNPTQGLTISVDGTDLYTKFPLGSKVYIKLKGLYLGQYGGVVQLGGTSLDELGVEQFGRIPNVKIDGSIIKSCSEIKTIVPKEISINEFTDNLIGVLVKVKGVEFAKGVRCSTFALEGSTVNKMIVSCGFDYTKPTTDAVNVGKFALVRNSGFATFYNQNLPLGNGGLVAILSKFSSDYQLFLRTAEDTKEMTSTRCDGVTKDCTPPADNATVAEIKSLLVGNLSQITADKNITVTVTANDDTGNFFKYVYIEDETGGIRLRLNATNLYQNPMFKVGRKITIACKNLYLGKSSGEIHLGALFNGNIGNIEEYDIYNYVFDNKENSTITPKLVTITNITNDDIGRLVKLEGVEFATGSQGVVYATTSDTNRTLKDCAGNTIIVRTSRFASYKSTLTPTGKGTFVGILNTFNGTNQLWVRTPNDLNMTGARCQ